VDIRLYDVIYNVIDEVKAAMTGMLKPQEREVVTGQAEVRQIFKVSKVGTIAGCYVRSGKIVRDAGVRLLRDNVQVYEGKLASLKRFKDDVKEVQEGYECGMAIENFNDLKEGDVIEAFTTERVAPASV
ncbi:MAG: translation initiation factor IF-2, partial [Candidatus Eremiobacteraeota bacterium]|nr:translation initiation factor IF-2 [Candidatus Eremiobacteraeota bacterium]